MMNVLHGPCTMESNMNGIIIKKQQQQQQTNKQKLTPDSQLTTRYVEFL